MFDNKSHTFYFIRHPMSGGGVHLSNLISLDPDMAPNGLVQKNIYFEWLIQQYQQFKINADLPNGCHVNAPEWPGKLTNYCQYPQSISTGHAASFYWAKSLLDTFPNKRYILLTFNNPLSQQILVQREKKLFNTMTLANEYYKEEIRFWYNQWFVDQNQIDDDINLPIEICLLFEQNIKEVIQLINQKYSLNIPVDQAQQLHDYWTKMNNN